MRTGLPKQKKITDIWFDEKDPLIHIRTHNTDLKKRLAAYAEQHPDVCRQTDADPVQQQPIFPDRLQSSIVGASELNYCVRDENRWDLTANVTAMVYIQAFA